MSDLDSEKEDTPVTEEPLVRKGRPTGRPDSSQRKRRTAQEISNDKVMVAQMKLDNLKEAEANKLANKRIIYKKPPTVQTRIPKQKPLPTNLDDSGSDSDGAPGLPNPKTSRQRLYDSWFK